MVEIKRRCRLFFRFQMLFPYFREEEEDNEQIQENNRPGDQSEHKVGIISEKSAKDWSDGKSQSEHSARESEVFRAIRSVGDIRNIGLTYGHPSASQTREKTGQHEYPYIPRIGKNTIAKHVKKGSKGEDAFTSIDI